MITKPKGKIFELFSALWVVMGGVGAAVVYFTTDHVSIISHEKAISEIKDTQKDSDRLLINMDKKLVRIMERLHIDDK